MSLIQKALGYQPGAFVLSVVVVDNLPQSFPQCKSLKGLSCLTQKFRENFTQSNNTRWKTTGLINHVLRIARKIAIHIHIKKGKNMSHLFAIMVFLIAAIIFFCLQAYLDNKREKTQELNKFIELHRIPFYIAIISVSAFIGAIIGWIFAYYFYNIVANHYHQSGIYLEDYLKNLNITYTLLLISAFTFNITCIWIWVQRHQRDK